MSDADALPPPTPSMPSLSSELAFMEALRVPFLTLDRELRVTYVNAMGREHLTVFGYDPTLLLGMQIWAVFPSARGTQVETALERIWDHDGPIHLEYYHPDTAQYVELDVSRHGEAVGIFWRNVASDHGVEVQRAEFEAELMSARRQLEEFIAGAPLAIIVVDNEFRVASWNPMAERMFQWTAEEVIGTILPTVPEEDRASFEVLLRKEQGGEFRIAEPARRRRKDGVMLDVQVSTAPLRNAAQEVIGVVGMITDITGQRKLEAQLRMAQKMEAVGLLAGGVAHDFNNVLTAIKGFASLLQLTMSQDAQAQEFLGEINKAADRAAALTAQLLAFSRRQLLRPEALDLNVRIRDLERMLRLLLRKDAELLLTLDPTLALVLVDPGQIEQVILNLVVNARDAVHGRPGGHVAIATSNVELRSEFILWGVEDAPGPYVKLVVRDNGVGMDAATQARIFDPFFTTKEPGRGTGLGLATLFGIVKQSGGYVWVDSAPEKGAAFTIYLPRAQSSARTSGPIKVTQPAGGKRILLVEDEAAVRRVARRTLELAGYEVIEAAEGVAALTIAREITMDLVLTDVMMPGMMGTEVARAILAIRPGTPVLFMSGHADEIARGGLLDPDTPFLAKPFSPSQLVQRVGEVLRSSAAR